jgi:anti-anti-sigma factor
VNGSVTVMIPAAGVAVVRLVGEFDMANIGELSLKADDVILSREPQVVIDLAEVMFLDSSMLKALVNLQQRVQGAGGAIVLVRPVPLVWRVFEVTHLDHFFRSFASAADAIEELAGVPLGAGDHPGGR